MNKDSTLAQTFSLLPCSTSGPAALDCRQSHSVFSRCIPSRGDWLTLFPQRWMSLWTACGIWVNCNYITGSNPVVIHRIGAMEEFASSQSMYTVQIFLCKQHSFYVTNKSMKVMSLERDPCTDSQCPAIILASLSPLSFHTEVCMNNVCHIASPSLKVTLVNYWLGHMITYLTSVCSRLALGSVFMSMLFFFSFFFCIPGDPHMMNYCLLLLLGECWRLYREVQFKITNVTSTIQGLMYSQLVIFST